MMQFTIAIPTYNGEQRLPEVLERLRSQVVPAAIAWEVLVVDNNSQDGTAQVVQAFQADFPLPLRYCVERRQGIGYARHLAVRQAVGELVGFLDDDNLPDANWVNASCEFAQTHPRAAAFASRIYADLEGEPPENFQQISSFLAMTQRGEHPLLYVPEKRLLPPGAGLVVRKQVWCNQVPEQAILGGRVEGNMLAGEDLEALTYIQRSGWEIWYNPAMIITHKIPAFRLTKAYLIPFFRGIGLSRYATRTAGLPLAKQMVLLVAYLISDLRKLILYFSQHHSRIQTDLVVACHWELLWSSLISPFYLWQKGYLRSPQSLRSNSLTQVQKHGATIDLTVAIPTFNGAEKLSLVLERLRSQVISNLTWEVIIVDNNSTDRTAEIIKQYQSDPTFPVPIRYGFEPRQGAGFARQQAIEVANGELVAFLDDDNLPDENWIQSAYTFAQNYPQAGAIASQVHGKFEVEPDPALRPILFYLALTHRGEKPIQYQPAKQGVPPSAGLVCRRQAWLAHVPRQLVFNGRSGQSMVSGEDAESLIYLYRSGWQIWYNPAMKVEHLIPAARLERSYLISLLEGVGLVRHHLRMLILASWKRPIFFWLYLMSDMQKSLFYYYKNRSILQTDTVAACEMKRLLSSLISPFYLWKLWLNRQVISWRGLIQL